MNGINIAIMIGIWLLIVGIVNLAQGSTQFIQQIGCIMSGLGAGVILGTVIFYIKKSRE